ncbi:MAG: ABC transporter substrate-binding protein [Oscillospiraceae bacterium]|nr:ABC transporter substrate-binding protein [Oscillospiraceae bacterium]
MKKLVSLTLAMTMCVSLLAGCGNKDASTTETAASAASAGSTATVAEPDVGIDTTNYLKIQDDNPDTVDPQATTEYYTVAMNIFDRLVEVKANGDGTSEIVPSLAKSWEISDDGLTYTFTLNEGVKFSNGADLTSSDVLYTIKRMLTYEKAVNDDIYDMIQGASDVAEGKTEELAGFKVIDDYNFSITLEEPYGAFLACLTTPGASIFDEETTEQAGDQFGIDPAVTIGTGPFTFAAWEFNSELVLSANKDYWDGAPACEGLVLKVIPDEATARMMFENGELDILDMDNNASQLEYFLNNDAYQDQIVSGPRVGVYYICLNEKFTELSDARVRKALQYSIDRQAILDSLYAGKGQLENGIFPHGLIGYNADLPEIPYDVEQAKALLAEAGYPDGFEMELCYSSDAGQTTKDMLEIISAYWAEIGVTAKVTEVDEGSFYDMRAAGEIESYTSNWSADFNDPDNFIYSFFGNESNIERRGFGYSNTEAIARVAAARAIVNEDERIAEYQDLEKLVIQEDAAWVPLFSKEHLFVVNPAVSGFQVSWNGWSGNYYRNVSVTR